MTDSSDGAVVRRVLSGDRDAFGILVDRHQRGLLAYVRHMGFGEMEAHDVVQDGFIRAFRHLRRCGEPDRFEGWLFKIVSNLCRTAGKRNSKRPMESLQTHQSTLMSSAPGPEEQMQTSAVRERVRGALDAVPGDQREALVLMYLQGHSVQEIADLTDASPSAVKMRLKRGRDALKQELAPFFSGADES
jgi:RNA polymerase sigma-70 factor (ECF subfamily)